MPEPVRFDVWMDRALYGPDGFYQRGGQAGRRGDFLTSPEVGPLFGRLVGQALDRWWTSLGEPDPFVVVEAAAGRGTLATAIGRAGPRCRGALRYVGVERSGFLRSMWNPTTGGSVEVRPELPDEASVIVANELLDNLAFRLLERVDAGWAEVWVEGWDHKEAPTLRGLDDDVPPVIAGLHPPTGTRLPRLDQAAAWVGEAQRRAPVVCCIDYGVASTSELVGRWWLRTYAGHERGSDPFAGMAGSADITTDVAVDQLPVPTAVRTQAEWLVGLGIEELVEEGRAAWDAGASVGDLATIEMRSRVRESEALCDPAGLGSFLVMEWS